MFWTNCIFALLTFMATIYYSSEYSGYGSPVDKDPNDPKYQTMAVNSLRQYEVENQLQNHYALLAVGRVTSAVVAGTKTIIDFFAAATVCKSGWDAYFATNCPLDNIADTLYCRSTIWTREWISKTETTVKCNKVSF